MLRVKQVRRYRVAKYPRGAYQKKPISFPALVLKEGAVTATMVLLLESCEGGGTTGPPPLRPDYVTESEARALLNRVLAENGISTVADVPVKIETAPGDSAELLVDAYNDSLEVGYEYIYEPDFASFNSRVVSALDSLAKGSGPHIKAIEPVYARGDYSEILEATMQKFLDTLRAHGVI